MSRKSFTTILIAALVALTLSLILASCLEEDTRDDTPPDETYSDCENFCAKLWECDPGMVTETWEGYGGCAEDCHAIAHSDLDCFLSCPTEDTVECATFNQCIVNC